MTLRIALEHFPWPVFVRATLAAAAWLFFPSWVFFAVALAVYLVPIFRPQALSWPMALIFLFASALEANPLSAVFLGALIFLVLGIKDLAFIDRRVAYETLVLLMLFAAALLFFFAAPNTTRLVSALGALALGALAATLASSLGEYAAPKDASPELRRRARVGASVYGLLLWELAWVLVIIPMNAFSRTAILFLATAVGLDLLANWLAERLAPRAVLANITVFLVFFVVILTANAWGV